MYRVASVSSFFFFNDTATTEIYTLSLHDALPISRGGLDALLGPERPGEEPVTPFVLLDGVHKQWSPTVRVGPLSLGIPRGEIVALLGPSGSGKTTVLRLLAGFEAPDAGRLVIDGEDVTALPPARRRCGMVFQHYALFPHLDVGGNVAFGLKG